MGGLLDWPHYAHGWNATCTAAAPAVTVSAATSLGLDAKRTAVAMALAIPAPGGVQRAFGTMAKPLQVGSAAAAGVRAARLAQAGTSADLAAIDEWLRLVGAGGGSVDRSGPAVPGGLAVKLFPYCFTLQRPISAVREFAVRTEHLARLVVPIPGATVRPLIHHGPVTGLQGKFSLEYAVAAALLDGFSSFASFEDAAVTRDEALRSVQLVEVVLETGGLLDGELTAELHMLDGAILLERLSMPPGSPTGPPTDAELQAKFASHGEDVPDLMNGLDWTTAPGLLRTELGAAAVAAAR